MPDDLYWDDTLAWSEQQSARLRRLAAGERVNDVDWEHVIEEIEDVGRTELRACATLLRRAIEHLMKLHVWPESPATQHWRSETRVFLTDAEQAFLPSMRQKLDLDNAYRLALRQMRRDVADMGMQADLPDQCPFTLDDLFGANLDLDALLASLRS